MTRNAHTLHEFLMTNSWSLTTLLDTASELVQEERDAQTHPAVVSLLESVHESLTTAAMEYEMSYK
jgi:hypothetical protein